MGFWKVAGGIGAGIGAVILLPVAGPVLAVTAVGAAVAGTIGGAAGVALSVADRKKLEEEKVAARHAAVVAKKRSEKAKKKKEDAERELAKLKKEKAETDAIQKAEEEAQKAEEEAQKAKEEANEALENLAAVSFDFIKGTAHPLATFITCCRLQISMANADGEISSAERSEVEEFIMSSENSEDDQWKDASKKVKAILENPPSMDVVLKEIKASKNHEGIAQDYLDLLVSVMLADGVIHQAELDFIDRFVEAFDSLEQPLELPYRCLNLPREIKEKTALVAICLEPNGTRCGVWINNEYRTSDKPLPTLSVENFKDRFDSVALEELDSIGECNSADHVCFVFCGEKSAFEHAQEVIKKGGDRYSISRYPCSDGDESA